MDAGKFFMFGFSGTRPEKAILDFIRNDKISGVILFRRNFQSPDQIKDLTSELQDTAGGNLLIGVDQEGGRVANLPVSIIDIPPMEKLGRDYVNNADARLAFELGLSLGEKLMSHGFNLDFAPVLDVNTNENNPVIGNRSFSSDPEVVAALGCELVRGMTEAGIITCGKHFPGHGDTSEDSHKALPLLHHDMRRLNEIELVPFKRAIDDGIPTLMTAHVIYKGVDQEVPATLSEKIMTDILRTSLGFEGVLFSDDLEMDAIAKNYDVPNAAVKAVGSGCDICLVCHSAERQRNSIDAVKRALDSGHLPEAKAQKSLQRISGLLKKYL